MEIHEQIREHRKKAGFTQEQVANYLGVSTPAVNKWEKGATFPDISLLAPLARLLKIDLNTLFSFHETLSEKEIGLFSNELAKMMEEKGVQAGFSIAAAKFQEYPTCDLLLYSVTLLLDGSLHLSALSAEEKTEYEQQVMRWYEQAANGPDERVREAAIYMMANRYLNSNQLEKAQELAGLLPDRHNPDHQMLRINLLLQQGKLTEAATLTETNLLRVVRDLQILLIKLVDIDIAAKELEPASQTADIARQAAALLDMWEYSAYVCPLQVAVSSKDAKTSVALLKSMLEAAASPWDVSKSVLYRHLPTKNMDDFGAKVIPSLLAELEKGEPYAFLRSNRAFQELLCDYRETYGQGSCSP